MTEAQISDFVRDGGGAEGIEIAGAGSLLCKLPAPPAHRRLELREHTGIVAYDTADLTVTVRAGTAITELAGELAQNNQDCPIEGPGSTVGGCIASGLSGLRRLGAGPMRDWLLGARMITADGVAVRLGGRTVKNVTGYDLPRLLCASWGTLGVLTELTLRVRPQPMFRCWYETTQPVTGLLRGLPQASTILQTSARTFVLLEGHPADCRTQAVRMQLRETTPPELPAAVRLSVPPAALAETVALIDGDWAAEVGVGTVHANLSPESVRSLRQHCEALTGRLLVLRRDYGLPAFGTTRSAQLDVRVKKALDPRALFAPWRFAA